MKTDPNNPSHITADAGKKFLRKADGYDFGTELYLGYTFYLGGRLLSEPRMEVPGDFLEVDMTPEEAEEHNNELRYI